jgi:hypothetical protein
MAASLSNSEWLARIERLLGEAGRGASCAPFPRDRFHCRLEDQPDHLVPEHCLAALWENPQRLLSPAEDWVFAGSRQAPPIDAEV